MFFFVIAAYVALVNPFRGSFDSEDKLVLIFVGFSALILSFASSFLFSKSEQKIEENTHSYGWLIKSNLALSLLLYVALIIFSVILVFISMFLGANGEASMIITFTMFYGLWLAPLAVLILNFIPSLFLYKFRSSKYLSKIIPLTILSLSLIFIVLNYLKI